MAPNITKCLNIIKTDILIGTSHYLREGCSLYRKLEMRLFVLYTCSKVDITFRMS